MSLADRLLLIYTIASVFQTLVVAISLAFIYVQARAARINVEQFEKTTRLNLYLEHKHETMSINQLLLNDPDLRQHFQLSKEELLVFVLLNHCETAFRLHMGEGVASEVWASQLALIRKVLASNLIKERWGMVRSEYAPDFAAFLDALRAEAREASPPAA